MHPAPIIAIWIALSSSVILFNAVSSSQFLYPHTRSDADLAPRLELASVSGSCEFFEIPATPWNAILTTAANSGNDEGDLNFHYPITLTTLHLVYAAIATRLMRRFTSLLDGLDNVEITWQRWYSTVSDPFRLCFAPVKVLTS